MSWITDHLFGAKTPSETNQEDGQESSGRVMDGHDKGLFPVNETATSEKPSSDALPVSPTQTQPAIDTSYEKREIVAEWRVPIRGKLHKIEFEHGTTSGRRVLWIDEKEVFRREWMFKLVGDDSFDLENLHCVLRVDPAPGFSYKYSLFVDGKPFEQFKHSQAKALRIWEITVEDEKYRVVLERDTLNIFVNGLLREEEGEFVDGGTNTKWEQDGNQFSLCARTSDNKREGLAHTLNVNGLSIAEISIDEST